MTRTIQSWRQPLVALNYEAIEEPVTRSELLRASVTAGKALELASSARQVLRELCAVFGNELCNGQAIVWPSNEYLCEVTGLSERSIRTALMVLADKEVIAIVRSPNGKRFAQKDRNGKLLRAYGFDLAPMWQRRSEFHNKAYATNTEKRDRAILFDQMTLCRRYINDAVVAHAENGVDTTAWMNALALIIREAPSRRSKECPKSALEKMEHLRSEIEEYTVSDGKNCRHIYNNNDFNNCNRAFEKKDEADQPSVLETVTACPDAAEVLNRPTNEHELVGNAVQVRGMVGVSEAGWNEARDSVGAVLAAKLLMYAVQLQAVPRPGTQQIQNLGGYFRTLVRMSANGTFNLRNELRKMRKVME